jgi:ribosome maturation factor RimP
VNTHRVDGSDRLRERVAGVVESYGLELFDLQFRRESHGWVLRVVIDRPWDESAAETAPEEPVGIDDCGRVSRDLDTILDVAKIVTQHPVGGQSHFAGRIVGIDNGAVVLAEGRRTHCIPLDAVRRARLDVEF